MRPSILIVSIAGLALRLAWWWYARPDPVADFEWYRLMAADLLEQHQLVDHPLFGTPQPSALRVPAYPVFLAVAMLVSRSGAWLSIVNVVLSTLLVPLVAWLARVLAFEPAAALTAAVLVAINPTFVFFSPVLASEHLFVVFLVLSLIVGTGARTRSQFAVAGLLFGAAVLTRPDALFYMPVLAGVVWLRSGSVRPIAPAILMLAAALVVAPWYVRNRVVVGPGAGLSTAGGLNFYYAHNDHQYGWHPLQGTPLEGLSEVAVQARGYELGFEFLSHAGLARIVSDIREGTVRLYSPSAYPFALYWSTLTASSNPDNNSPNALHESAALQGLTGLYRWLLWGAGLSLLLIRRTPSIASGVLYGLLAMNWVGYCWIFWADSRFRFLAEVVFCMLTALVVSVVVRSLRWQDGIVKGNA